MLKDKFSGIKISHRMFIFFQAATIGIIIIFAVLIFTTNMLYNTAQKILIENVSSIKAAYDVEIALLGLKGLKSNYMLNNKKKYLDDFNGLVDDFNKAYNAAFGSAKTDEEKNILSIMAIDFDKYIAAHYRILELYNSGHREEAIALLLGESSEIYTKMYGGCEKLIDKNQRLIQESEKNALNYLNGAKITGYVVIILFIFIGVLLAFMLTKTIIDPINKMKSDSDSVIHEHLDGSNEIESLKIRFEKMIKNIKDGQQKLIQAEKKAAIGQMAAGISHELNNPMGIICGFSERLLKKGELKAHQRETVREIYDSAMRCRTLLGSILEFAREPQIVLRKCDLKKILEWTEKVFKKQDKYSDVVIRLKSGKKAHWISADEQALKQVMVNLILNSSEAMDYKGTVKMNLSKIKGKYRILLKDTGPGIKQGDEENIFSPFYTTKAKGVGLGLSICRNIIEKHEGILYAEPFKEGAKFVIELPEEKHEKRG